MAALEGAAGGCIAPLAHNIHRINHNGRTQGLDIYLIEALLRISVHPANRAIGLTSRT